MEESKPPVAPATEGPRERSDASRIFSPAVIVIAVLIAAGAGGFFYLDRAAQKPPPLNLVEINCVFYDPYGQVVLRQRTPIVSPKAGGLAAGVQKPFRLPFDTIPESWNNVMPQLVIARIDFE